MTVGYRGNDEIYLLIVVKIYPSLILTIDLYSFYNIFKKQTQSL